MRILALSPYHGGSHRSFFDLWTRQSRHDFCLASLPARHFPWRMRQGSVGLATQARSSFAQEEPFDLVFTTSMLNAAELRGLLPSAMRDLPLIVYFHENQLVYPIRKEDERNQHFSCINWVSALAATENWFNSEYNRTSFLTELERLLRKMPDENSLFTLDEIANKSRIEPICVETGTPSRKEIGPLHIAWAGRWEHDKRPDLFFDALGRLREEGMDFRVTCLGQSFRSWPPEFDQARRTFSNNFIHFGYLKERSDYLDALGRCDVIVSTADHEFFGIALLEAVGCGCIPVVPRRVVYPELYPESCIYEGDAPSLARHLLELARLKDRAGTLTGLGEELGLEALTRRFHPETRVPQLDNSCERVLRAACLTNGLSYERLVLRAETGEEIESQHEQE